MLSSLASYTCICFYNYFVSEYYYDSRRAMHWGIIMLYKTNSLLRLQPAHLLHFDSSFSLPQASTSVLFFPVTRVCVTKTSTGMNSTKLLIERKRSDGPSALENPNKSKTTSRRQKKGDEKKSENGVLKMLGKKEFQLDDVRKLVENTEIKREEEALKQMHNKSKNLLSNLIKRRLSHRDRRTKHQTEKSSSSSSTTTTNNYNVSSLLSSITPSSSSNTSTRIINKHFNDDDKNWHNIEEIQPTPEQERDLRVIENREHLNPKRFYKSMGTGRKQGQLPTRVHFGKVVAGPHEFYSARMTKKEQKHRIIDEILGDSNIVKYVKKRSTEYQLKKSINKRVIDPAAKKNKKNRRRNDNNNNNNKNDLFDDLF